jgi:hypothetical protein
VGEYLPVIQARVRLAGASHCFAECFTRTRGWREFWSSLCIVPTYTEIVMKRGAAKQWEGGQCPVFRVDEFKERARVARPKPTSV